MSEESRPRSLQLLHEQVQRQHVVRLVVGLVCVFAAFEALKGALPDTGAIAALYDFGSVIAAAFVASVTLRWRSTSESRPVPLGRVKVAFKDIDNVSRYTGMLWREGPLLVLDGPIRHFAITHVTADAVVVPGEGVMVPPKLTLRGFGKPITYTVEPINLWDEGGKAANQELHKILQDWAASTESADAELLPRYRESGNTIKAVLFWIGICAVLVNGFSGEFGHVVSIWIAEAIGVAAVIWLLATKSEFERKAGRVRRSRLIKGRAELHG